MLGPAPHDISLSNHPPNELGGKLSLMNRRTFLKGLAAVIAVIALPVNLLTNRPAPLIIAASDSPPASKRQADLVTNGRNDATVIQRAVDQVGARGGIIRMAGGTFYLNNTIDYSGVHGGTIEGCTFVMA